MKRKKRTVLWLCIVAIVILMINIKTGISIYLYGKIDDKQKADAIIVLGAETTDDGVSPVYRERLNHAIWLYKSGYAENIITTGGVANGNREADAQIAKQYIVENGVPESVAYTEKRSVITEENLRFAKEIMNMNNFYSCIIVSDPLHMKRAMLMAKDVGIKAFSSPTPTTRYKSLKTQIPFLIRENFFYLGYCAVRMFK